MVTLRQLRYLEALAETRHFGHAAEICAITQPALSMQIKELEDELQVSLIERRKSGIELTEEGAEIVRRGRTILASVRDLLDYAKHRERLLTGSLKLGAIPSIAPYLLPAALAELQRRFPNLALHLRETITETLIRELIGGDLDLILIALPIGNPEIETLHLFDDKFLLAVRATKGKRAKATEILSHERLLLLEEGHCLRDQALSFCRLVSPEARETFGASSLATIVQMVAHGHGITLLPEMAVASEVRQRSDIRLLHFSAPEPKREIGLAWRKTSPRKTEFHAFAALLKHATGRLGRVLIKSRMVTAT
jgi:LysR family hydrogen peroxide-inducible transcriptional activator